MQAALLKTLEIQKSSMTNAQDVKFLKIFINGIYLSSRQFSSKFKIFTEYIEMPN